MANARIDDFSGSTEEYIIYLETQIRELRQKFDKNNELANTARMPLRDIQPTDPEVAETYSISTTPTHTPRELQPIGRHITKTRSTKKTRAQTRQQQVFSLERPKTPDAYPLKPPKWMAVMKGFTDYIPASEEDWQKRRCIAQVATEEGVVNSINYLTLSSSRNLADSTSNTTAAGGMGDSDIIRNYREGMAKLEGEKMRAQQISRFGALLYTCSCVVAIANNADENMVDRDMGNFFGSKARKDYFRQVRKGALWAIKQINKLQGKGLRHRAWELFFLCGTEMSTYEKCTHYKDSSRFSELISVAETPEGEKPDLSFNIPILVWKIGAGMWSISLINKALVTEVSEEGKNAWIKAFSAAQRPSGERSPRDTNQRAKRLRLDQTTDTIDDFPHQVSMQGSHGGQGMHALLSAVGLQQPYNDHLLSGINPLALNAELTSPRSITNGTQDAPWLPEFDHPDFSLNDFDPLIDDFSLAEIEFIVPDCTTYFLDFTKCAQELIDQAHAIKFTDLAKTPFRLDYALVHGNTRIEAINHHHQKLTSVLKAWELQWPPILDSPTKHVVSDLDSQIRQRIGTDKYDWEAQLVLLKVGGLRPRDVSLCGIIIPVQISEADHNRWVQFDKARKDSLIAVKEWPVLSILPGDICIRTVKCQLIFIWVQVYPNGTLDLST